MRGPEELAGVTELVAGRREPLAIADDDADGGGAAALEEKDEAELGAGCKLKRCGCPDEYGTAGGDTARSCCWGCSYGDRGPG